MAIKKHNWLTAKDETPETIDEFIDGVEGIAVHPIHEDDESEDYTFFREISIVTGEQTITLTVCSNSKTALQVKVLAGPKYV